VSCICFHKTWVIDIFRNNRDAKGIEEKRELYAAILTDYCLL
jgi:hypothetical protein